MQQKTGILLIDPLNEFLHADGKLYPLLKPSIDAADTIKNLYSFIETARKAKIPIFYCQHQLIEDGHYDRWNHMTKSQRGINTSGAFRVGTFGGQIYEGMGPDKGNGDVVVSRHWNSRYAFVLPNIGDKY